MGKTQQYFMAMEVSILVKPLDSELQMRFGLSKAEFMQFQILEGVENMVENGIMPGYKQKNKMYLMISYQLVNI